MIEPSNEIAELRKDARDLLASFLRNKKYLVEALNHKGYPSSWLSGWEAKLRRMAQK